MKKSNQFCQDILDLDIARSTSVLNLVMALSSYELASNPVALSESKLFSGEYHSVYRAIQDLVKDNESYRKVNNLISELCLKYSENQTDCYTLQTDTSPLCKPHSPCLKDRGYVEVPNKVIAKNASLSKGYKYSFINLGLSQPSYSVKQDVLLKTSQSKWTAPVSIARVEPGSNPRLTAVEQLKDLFENESLPFKKASLVYNTLDSHYGNARYLASVHHQANLVNIVRFRGSIKIYPQQHKYSTGGTSQIYGDCHYLIEESGMHHYKYKEETKQKYRKSVLDLACNELFSIETQTKQGKPLEIKVRRFNNMMLRSTNGYNMKDKPFDLLYVRVFDKSKSKKIFKPMWLAIAGQKRREVSSFQAYCKYSHRYDIEPFFRFSKQKLLLDSYQTSKVEYLDNWMLIIQMAIWLLWTGSMDACKNPKPWQRYLAEYKNHTDSKQENQSKQTSKKDSTKQRLTIAQTRKGAQRLYLTFDLKPFKIQKSNKGTGREPGTKLEPKKRYKVVKKDQNLVQKRAT